MERITVTEAARRTVERLTEIVARGGTTHEAFRTIVNTTAMQRNVLDAAILLCTQEAEWQGDTFDRTRSLLQLAQRSLLMAA
jgi:hypothetical protein